jgi:hypothetical protein
VEKNGWLGWIPHTGFRNSAMWIRNHTMWIRNHFMWSRKKKKKDWEWVISFRKLFRWNRKTIMWFRNDMLGTMWSRNHTGEAETFVIWSWGGVEIFVFLLDRTARMDTKKFSAWRGSFGGFEATCFQLDRAARIDSTCFFYISCDRSTASEGGRASAIFLIFLPNFFFLWG